MHDCYWFLSGSGPCYWRPRWFYPKGTSMHFFGCVMCMHIPHKWWSQHFGDGWMWLVRLIPPLKEPCQLTLQRLVWSSTYVAEYFANENLMWPKKTAIASLIMPRAQLTFKRISFFSKGRAWASILHVVMRIALHEMHAEIYWFETANQNSMHIEEKQWFEPA